MGPRETSVVASSYIFEEAEIFFTYRSGRGKKRFLVRQNLDIPVSGSYRVAQLHNY